MKFNTILKDITEILPKIVTNDNVIEIGKKMYELIKAEKNPYVEKKHTMVARALQQVHVNKSPRFALVGITTSGKSALANALFGEKVMNVKRTIDTTDRVFAIEFRSGLVIYDTPGVCGDEKLGNTTRSFIGLPQDESVDTVERVPFERKPKPVKYLSPEQVSKEAPIDSVIFVIDLSQTLIQPVRKELRALYRELRDHFHGHVVVAGTHFDDIEHLDERDDLLKTYQQVTNHTLIPISSVSGYGLDEFVTALFQTLPDNVSLSKLQKSLVNEHKLSRLEFVITECANILGELSLLDGHQTDELQIGALGLFAMICNHYAINEETWLKYNGGVFELGQKAAEHGVNLELELRDPDGFWETIDSWFGEDFYRTVVEYQRVGVDGLAELLPGVYSLIYELSRVDTPEVHKEHIVSQLQEHSDDLKSFIDSENSTGVADQVAEILHNAFVEF